MTTNKKISMITVGLLGIVFIFMASAANAATVQLTPSFQSVQTDNVFSLLVEGTGFTESVTNGGFSVSWDETILELRTPNLLQNSLVASADSFDWDAIANPYVLSPTLNQINVALESLIGPRSGQFSIAELEFRALDVDLATAALFSFRNENTIQWGTLDVSTGLPVFTALVPQPDYVDAQIEITPPAAVPVPGAVWLFGSGLLGMVGLKRRRKS